MESSRSPLVFAIGAWINTLTTMFNFFKKKPDYDPLSLQVTDLKKGFIFEYDLRSWEVKEEYTYDWGDNFFSKEYKIFDGSETRFLSVEEEDNLELAIHEKVRMSSFEEDIEGDIIRQQRPPKVIRYKDITFRLDEEAPGYFDDGSGKWVEFISWDYYDAQEEYVLTIEQWEERTFEASFGKCIEAFEISNIFPNEQ